MSKCRVSFGPDDKITNKQKLEEIMKSIEDIKSKSKGPSDFSKKAKTFLNNIQREAKINEMDRLESELATSYNISMMEARKKAYTNSKGEVDYVGMYFSYLRTDQKVGENLKNHNVEAIINTTQTDFVRILDKYLSGETVKEKLELGNTFLRGVVEGVYTKEAFDYIESGGKAQVSDEAMRLASMMRDLADTGLNLKQGAGFLTEGLDNYFISQGRAYRAEKIKGNEASFVEDMFNNLNIEKTFPDLSEKEIKDILGSVATKIVANFDKVYSEADINKEVSDFFSSKYKKRYSKQRKFTFNEGGFYKIYTKYGDNDILESIKKDTQRLSTDVAFRTIFGPLADQPGHGRQAFKSHIQKLIKSQIKEDGDFYYKQFKKINRQADMVSSGGITEKALIDNLTGEVHRPVNNTAADVGNFLRTLTASQILGRSILASIADLPQAISRISEISGKNYLSTTGDLISQAFDVLKSPELKKYVAEDIAIPSESALSNEIRIISSDSALNRITNIIGKGFTLANPLTHSQRWLRSATATLDSIYVAKAVSTSWDKLDPIQKTVMSQYGINEELSKLAKQYSKASPFGKEVILTDLFLNIPDDVLKEVNVGPTFNTPVKKAAEIKRRFDSYFFYRSQSGVPLAGLSTKAILNQGYKAGTFGGEFLRSAAMLKSISLAVYKNAVEIYNINKASGRDTFNTRNAQFFGSMLGAGYAVVSIQALSNNESPPDPTSPSTMADILLKGGILGPLFDISASSIDDNTNQAATNLMKSAAGPVFTKSLEYAGALLTTLSTENQEKFNTFKVGAGPIGFANALVTGDKDKLSKDLMYLYRQLPGNNLLPVDILLKNILFDTIRRNNDPRYDDNKYKRQQQRSGMLFEQRDLF